MVVKSDSTDKNTDGTLKIKNNNKIKNNKNFRRTERGNVFFTLFGAVAIVGVLGAGIMATMRGPLSTMVEVNRRTQAEAEMSIASKLVLLEATETLANDGDCDSDGFVEPLEFLDATPKPTGGGQLPAGVASNKIDPWGTEYGYCAWDAGPTIDDAGCGGGTQDRLDGTGDSDETYTVIAVISAGSDRKFDTTCAGGASPSVTKSAGADDIISSYNYQTATAASGGLWKIKSGEPSTAEISKDLEVTGGATFSAGIDLSTSSAALQLGAASMLLPTDGDLGDAACDGDDPGNNYLLRVNTGTTPFTAEICDNSNGGWVSVAAGANIWSRNALDTDEIYYDTDNVGIGLSDPTQALDVVGNVQMTGDAMVGGDVTIANGNSVVWASAAAINEVAGALEIDAAGANPVEVTVSNDAVDINADVTITGSATGPLLVVNDSTSSDVLTVEADGDVGIGVASPNNALDVAGSVDVTNAYEIDGNRVLYTDGASMSGSVMVGISSGTNVTGDSNTVLGGGAAATLTSGTGNIVLGAGVDVPAATQADYLNIGDAIHADLANKYVGIGYADTYDVSTFNDALEVNGDIDAEGTITAGVAAHADPATNPAFQISDGSTVVPFGPAKDCADDEKLEWTHGTGWSCGNDAGSGSGGGGGQTLSETLTEGNDANAQDASNFDQIGAVQYCREDLTDCVESDDLRDANKLDGEDIKNTLSADTTTDNQILVWSQTNGQWEISTAAAASGVNELAVDTSINVAGGCTTAGHVPITDGAGDWSCGTPSGAAISLDDLTDAAVDLVDRNMFIGHEGGAAGDNNDMNISVGTGALVSLNNAAGIPLGDNNAAFGYFSLNANTTGWANTAIGAQVLASNTTGAENTGIGSGVLFGNTTGDSNTAVGRGAMFYNTTGSDNIAIGSLSFYQNRAREGNIAIGTEALRYADSTTTNSYSSNIAIGYYSLYGSTTAANNTGIYNTALGGHTLFSNTSGANNLALGMNAGRYNTTGGSNVFLGSHSGYANTSGGANIALGYQAGLTNLDIEQRNILIGAGVDTNNTDDYLNIGNALFGTLGDQTSQVDGGASLTVDGDLTITGTCTGCTAAGSLDIDDLGDALKDANNLFMAHEGGSFGATDTYNTAIGINALDALNNSAGTYNTALGYNALSANTDGDYSVAIGYGALLLNTTGTENVAIGGQAMTTASSASYNHAIGKNALYELTSGNSNIAIGHSAMNRATTAENNIALGHQAMFWSQTGARNFMAGYRAGYGAITASDINDNIAIGYQAGYALLTGGDDNILLGYQAGDTITTGARNIVLGRQADTDAATTDDYLNIGNAIYGVMDTNGTSAVGDGEADLTIDGDLTITGTCTGCFAGVTLPIDISSSSDILENGADTYLYLTTNNTFLGRNAGSTIDTGTNNVFIGENSGLGSSTITGSFNTFLGNGTGNDLTSGASNVLLGHFTGYGISTGSENTFIGRLSGLGKTTGDRNIFLGYGTDSPTSTSTASYEINIGNVLYGTTGTTDGEYSTLADGSADLTIDGDLTITGTCTGCGAGGASAIDDLSDAAKNTTDNNLFMAHEGGSVGANDDYNTGVGIGALDALNNSNADNNTAIGYNALTANTSGNNNTAVGSTALQANTTGTTNMAIGGFTMVSNTSGTSNTGTGSNALRFNRTGNYNTAVGTKAGMGVGAASNISNNSILGYEAGVALLTGGDDNTLLGYQAGDAITTGARNIVIGSGVDTDAATTDDYLNIGNTILGDMGTNPTTPGTGDADLTIDGDLTITGTCTGCGAAGITFPIDADSASSPAGVIIDINSGANNFLSYEGTGNLYLGTAAGDARTSGQKNTFIGVNAGAKATSGSWNLFYGMDAGYNMTTGSSNILIGEGAGYNANSSENIAIGSEALANRIGGASTGNTVTGNGNIAIGFRSGGRTTTGTNNFFFGYRAGDNNTTGSRNIIMGYDIDNITATTSDYLNIGNMLFGTMGDQTSTSDAGADLTLDGDLTLTDLTITGTCTGCGAGGLSFPIDVEGETVLMEIGTGNKNVLYYSETYGNVAFGEEAGEALTTSAYNVFLGKGAGIATTTGGSNVFIGHDTGSANIDGEANIFIGRTAGQNMNVSGWAANVFLGYGAGQQKTSGTFNVIIGDAAGQNSGTGSNNIFIGRHAGDYATADNNTLIGYQAGKAASGSELTGTDNTFVGYQTGLVNTVGGDNTFIGDEAGKANTTGSRNTYIGASTAPNNNTNDNVFVGTQAGTFASSVAGSVFVGRQAGYNATTGDDNTFLGRYAGFANTTGADNIVIGDSAGYTNLDTESRNILIGNDVDGNDTDDYLNIGNTLFGDMGTNMTVPGTGDADLTIDGDLTITGTCTGCGGGGGGGGAIDDLSDAAYDTATDYNLFMGHEGGSVGANDDYNLAIGQGALDALDDSGGDLNIAIGYEAGTANTSGDQNVFIGVQAGEANTTGSENTFIGVNAGISNTTGEQNTYVGSGVGENNDGSYNTVMGRYAMRSATGANYNSIYGHVAAQSLTTGAQNTVMGYAAANEITTGSSNVAIGVSAMDYVRTGSSNTAVGYQAGLGVSTSSNYTGNSILGFQAGRALLTGGDSNTLIGFQAGDSITTGAHNIIIGSGQDASGATVDEYLNIGSAIYGTINDGDGTRGIGDGDADLTIDGNLTITGTCTGCSGVGSLTFPIDAQGEEDIFELNSSGATLMRHFESDQVLAIGRDAGAAIDDANNALGNVFIGDWAGTAVTTADYNTFVGDSSGSSNTDGAENTFIGTSSGSSNVSGDYNAFLGTYSGINNTGDSNVFLGHNAGQNNTTGSGNVIVGAGIDNTTASTNYYLNIGNAIYGAMDDDGTSAVGDGAADITIDGDLTITGTCTGCGGGALSYPLDVEGETVLMEIATGNKNVLYYDATNDNTAFGEEAGEALTSGTSNVMVGTSAGASITTGGTNVFIGKSAGASETGGQSNVMIGSNAGQNINANSWSSNTIVGSLAGQNKTGGYNNTLIGDSAGQEGAGAAEVTALGFQAGMYATATSNTYVGHESGRAASGSELTGLDNTFVGYRTGYVNTSGADNTFIGDSAGVANASGADNTLLGSGTGAALNTESRNILIGSGVDTNDTDDYLNIGNAFYGDLGTTTSTGTDDAALFVDGSLGLGITPTARLHLQPSATQAGITVEGTTTDTIISMKADSGQNNRLQMTTNSVGTWYVGSDSTDSNKFKIDYNDATMATPLLAMTTAGAVTLTDLTVTGTCTGCGGGGGGALDDLSDAMTNATDDNIFIGNSGGAIGSNNTQNTAIGLSALDSLTNSAGANEGDLNTAVGYQALTSLTTGYHNTAMGANALAYNTANFNSALGAGSLNNTTSGGSNVGVGYNSGYNNTTGSNNTFVGSSSGFENDDGVQNVAVGAIALQDNTSGDYNTALGYAALADATIADSNTAVGTGALRFTQTGANNTAVGLQAGLGVSTSSNVTNNVFIGYQAGRAVLTGANSNVMVGLQAGLANTTGAKNVFIGLGAGDNNTTGSGNIVIGYNLDNNSATEANYLRIGNGDAGDAIKGTIGSGNLSAQGTGWNFHSDIRLKKDIREIDHATDKLNKIRGILFKWNDKAQDRSGDDFYGVIAQDVQKVFPEMVSQKEGAEYLEVNYTAFIPVLVEAAKELNEENKVLQGEIKQLKDNDENMQASLQKLNGQVDILNKIVASGVDKAEFNLISILLLLSAFMGGFGSCLFFLRKQSNEGSR